MKYLLQARLQNHAWFEKFDDQQRHMITELAIGKPNQNKMMNSLNSVHNKVILYSLPVVLFVGLLQYYLYKKDTTTMTNKICLLH